MTIYVPTPVLVSAIDGRLMCSFDVLHKFLEDVAGGPLWTHQLPSAMDRIGPYLAEQHPWVAALNLPTGTPENVEPEQFWGDVARRLTREHRGEHGGQHAVEPMTDFSFSNPVADLVSVFGRDRVVPVVVTEEERP